MVDHGVVFRLCYSLDIDIFLQSGIRLCLIKYRYNYENNVNTLLRERKRIDDYLKDSFSDRIKLCQKIKIAFIVKFRP